MKIGGDHIKITNSLVQFLVATAQSQAHQAVTHQHQLTDHIHDLIQPGSIHPYSGFDSRIVRCGYPALVLGY